MKSTHALLLAATTASVCLALTPETSFAQSSPPAIIPVQGVVATRTGQPVQGPQQVKFSLWDAPTGGEAVWESQRDVYFSNGFFSTGLGEVTDLDLDVFGNYGPLFLEVRVGQDSPMSRIAFQTTPYAGYSYAAISAELLGGYEAEDFLYSAGEGLVKDGNTFGVSREAVEGWARGVCFDTRDELIAELSDMSMVGPDDLATVAMSGSYNDLTGTPDLSGYATVNSLATVATSGAYADLAGTPDLSDYATTASLASFARTSDLASFVEVGDLAAVATSGLYEELVGAPDLTVFAKSEDLATVAASGSYGDLTDTPDLSGFVTAAAVEEGYVSVDAFDELERFVAFEFSPVAFSGEYGDLAGTPDLSVYAQAASLANYARTADLATVATSGSYTDLSGTPNLAVYARATELATVATSGAYTDLAGTPDLSVYATNASLADYARSSNLTTVATTGLYDDLSGTPDLSVYATTASLTDYATTASLATVATSGAYGDLTGTPDLSGYATTASLAAVATSGSYTDLADQPNLANFVETGALSAVAFSGDYNDLANVPSGGGGGVSPFGDGSAGDLTITGSVDWGANPPANFNLQFDNLTVSGVLTVPAGTIIRCAGDFTLEAGASITVEYGSRNIQTEFVQSTNSSTTGHVAIPQFQAARILKPRIGGGAGDPGFTWEQSFDAAGGGSITILAAGAVNLAGGSTITADGQDAQHITIAGQPYYGAGGGAGGVVVVASATSVTAAGSISLTGGGGGNGYNGNGGDGEGGGGGGGGGVAHFVAPTVSTVGATINVTGGAGGSNANGSSASSGIGSGGSGGASGGTGGRGGYRPYNGTFYSSTSGGDGYVLVRQTNPSAILTD